MTSPVLIVGTVALDTIKTTTAHHIDLLGGSAVFAGVAASFYSPSRIVAVIGNDFPPHHRQFLLSKGIDLEGLEEVAGKTFRWAGEYEEDMNIRHTLFTELNVLENFQPKIPSAWRDTEYVLLGNVGPLLQMDVLRQMKKPKFVLADTIEYWINFARPDFLKLLPQIDMLMINDSEARLITGEQNLFKAARAILKLGPHYLVVKKGEHGCLLFGENDFFSLGAYPLDEIIDPTGAGDCFAGAFLGALAREGDVTFQGIKKALVQGTLLASFNVEAFSLRRLEKLTADEIAQRHREFLKFSTL